MKAAQRIRGVLSPVVTPFSKDLGPDPVRFIALRFIAAGGCNA